MNARTTIFLSIMTSIFIVSKTIPFSIGEPLDVFFGVLFSYYAGNICIVYIYFLTTLDVITMLPVIFVSGPEIKAMIFSTAATDPQALLVANLLPDWVLSLILVVCLYAGVTGSVFSCRWMIKKMRLIDRFRCLST